ncbi:hypothetical protein L1887_37406 [Cichorium endivia]|nr:hypothetical protein L1887_37406 [Cichorium endivia]
MLCTFFFSGCVTRVGVRPGSFFFPFSSFLCLSSVLPSNGFPLRRFCVLAPSAVFALCMFPISDALA